MKAAVFYEKGVVRVEEADTPQVGPGEIVVEVRACGVCGTDVHIYGGDKGAADVTPPVILGHEFAGIVSRTGAGVEELRVGDRVCVDPNALCGACTFCRNGAGHFCTHMTGIGTTANGGFAQYCVVPARQAHRLADTVSFAQGAMAEPVSCCLHGIDLCEIKAGSTVAVIGGGMIGLLMLQLARLSGAGRALLLEPVESKRALGKTLGADLCIDPLHEDVGGVLKENHIAQIDTVIECVGRRETVQQAIELAGKQSVVMLFGLTAPDDEIAVKPFDLFRKEIVLKASFINPYTMGRAVALINSGRIDVHSMACPEIPLDALDRVLSSARERQRGKFIVNPWLE